MQEKTVSEGAMRAVMDAAEEVIGVNGLKALLNYAGLTILIEKRPEYTFEKMFTDDQYTQLIGNFYTVLGIPGAKAVFRMLGRTIARRTTSLGFYDQYKDLPPRERLIKTIESYIAVSGRGRILFAGDVIVFDYDNCSTCRGFTSDKPICTLVSGMLDGFAVWAGCKDVRSEETRCRAMGHETCRYEIKLKD